MEKWKNGINLFSDQETGNGVTIRNVAGTRADLIVLSAVPKKPALALALRNPLEPGPSGFRKNRFTFSIFSAQT